MPNTPLIFILRKIGSALDSLIELAGRKAEAVLTGDLSDLDQVVCAEEELSKSLHSLDVDRAGLMAGGTHIESREVEELRLSLRTKAERLKILNERNQRLLRQGLDLVEFELKMFMPQPSYKSAARPGPVLVDFRV